MCGVDACDGQQMSQLAAETADMFSPLIPSQLSLLSGVFSLESSPLIYLQSAQKWLEKDGKYAAVDLEAWQERCYGRKCGRRC